MGYCSDVVIEMNAWTFKQFLRFVKQRIGHRPDQFLDCLGNNSILNSATFHRFKDGQIAISYTSTRWYRDYPDVGVYYDFTESEFADDPRFGMHLTRTGDDYDDNEYEEWGNITNYAMIERSIEFWGDAGQEFDLLL